MPLSLQSKQRIFLISLAGIITTISLVGIFYDKPNKTLKAPRLSREGHVILEGKSVCLPTRDKNAPQTDGCVLGIQTENGVNYALDTQTVQTAPRMRVEGILVPIEAVSSEHWQKYDVKAIMKVVSISIVR